MELHPADIILAIINLIVLFVLLRLILWKPVNSFLSARIDRISADVENAAEVREAAKKAQLEYEEKLKAVESQSFDIMREVHAKASKEAEELLQEAQKKSEKMISEANERIAAEMNQAIIDSRYEIAQLATEIASRILKREVSTADTKSLIDDFFLETR